VHHSTPKHFQPPSLTANIDLRRWLGKRKVRRPKSQLQVILFEKIAQKFVQHAFEIGEADVLSNHQPLDLMKHRSMGLIRITPEYAPRRDDSQWWFATAHHPDLDRRGMGAKQTPIREVERVLHRASRVVRGNIQRLEVMKFVLNLGALGYLESDLAKQLGNAIQGAGDGVESATLRAATGERHVDTLAAQA